MKNKKIILAIIFAIIIISLIFIWAFFNSEKEVINEEKEIIPQEEISDEQLRTTTVTLYFINKETGEFEKEFRKIDSKKLLKNAEIEIINMWKNGPENSKLTTGCLNNFEVKNIEIKNNCAIINLSNNLVKIEEQKEINELKIIYCLVNNLTELNEINSIKILINDEENIYFGDINLSEEFCKLEQ